MPLPWLNRRKHESEIGEAQSVVQERQAELDAMRLAVSRQIQDALVPANSAKRLVELCEEALRPQSEATLGSTVIAYASDRTDVPNLLAELAELSWQGL